MIPINADHSSICKFAAGDANCELVGGSIVALPESITNLASPTVLPSTTDVSSPAVALLPELTIHIAMWGERNVTSVLKSRIRSDQTLDIDTLHDIDTGDPWYLVHKVTCVLYSYAGQPLNLLVTHDGSGIFSIHPEKVEPISFLDPLVDRLLGSGSVGEGVEVLAVIWGSMLNRHEPVSGDIVEQIYKHSEVECIHKYFRFDDYPNEHKTCQVFYRMRNDLETMFCKVGREHPILILDQP